MARSSSTFARSGKQAGGGSGDSDDKTRVKSDDRSGKTRKQRGSIKTLLRSRSGIKILLYAIMATKRD